MPNLRMSRFSPCAAKSASISVVSARVTICRRALVERTDHLQRRCLAEATRTRKEHHRRLGVDEVFQDQRLVHAVGRAREPRPVARPHGRRQKLARARRLVGAHLLSVHRITRLRAVEAILHGAYYTLLIASSARGFSGLVRIIRPLPSRGSGLHGIHLLRDATGRVCRGWARCRAVRPRATGSDSPGCPACPRCAPRR